MEGILIFIALLVIVLPIAAIIIAIRANDRARRIEEEIVRLQRFVLHVETPPTRTAPMTDRAPVESAEPPAAVPSPAIRPPPKDLSQKIDTLRDMTQRERPVAPEALAMPSMPAPEPAGAASAPSPEPSEPSGAEPPESASATFPPFESFFEKPSAPRTAKAGISLEEQVGARLFVWIASIALFLAVALFVKYTFEHGLLGPKARVMIGAAFGLVLLGAGEWWRKAAARIAQGVTAAGVAALFASFLAATSLYGLVNRPVGFGLLALTTAAAVALSLRQGPFVALLGLIGGFATPALIGSEEPRPGPLFTYLFVLQCGLLVVTRKRRWYPLSALTLIAAVVWVAVWLSTSYQPAHSSWIGPFLIASVAAFVASSYHAPSEEQATGKAPMHVLSMLGALLGMLMLAMLVGAGKFSSLDWMFLGILGAGAIVLGRIDARYQPLAWMSAALGVGLLIAWKLQTGTFEAQRFARVALAFGALYGAGGYAAMWGARPRAGWAWLSVAATVAYLMTAYWLLPEPPFAMPWGALTAGLAVLYAAVAVPVYRRRAAGLTSDEPLAALCVGVTALISLAIPMELEREWIAVAWALELPALALIEERLRVSILRKLASILACVTGVWLVQGGVLHYPIGPHVVFNWIAYGYGIPAASFAVAAWRYRRQGARVLAEALDAGSIVFTFLLVTLEVRHAFHRTDLGEPRFPFREWAAYVNGWLILSACLLLAERRWPRTALSQGARAIGAAAAVVGIVVLALGRNPLWAHEAVGAGRIINDLLYVYGLPALLMAVVAWLMRARGCANEAPWAAAWALGFGVLLTFLQTRQWFHGEFLDSGAPRLTEWSAYVCGWLIIAGLLMAAARRWPSRVLVLGGQMLAALAAAAGLLALALVRNPLWNHDSVGTLRILNGLLACYGLPALLMAGAGALLQRDAQTRPARFAGCWALLMVFLLVTLEVRQWFHGEFLDARTTTNAEWYAYSAAWVVFGTLLLVTGILTHGLVIRWASLLVMLTAVGKVFLSDMSHLRDLYRVVSLLGLGVSLLLLAFLYQRFVFARPVRTAED